MSNYNKFALGDLVKFSKEHIASPGHGYVQSWIGVVVESKAIGIHEPIPEIRIMWNIDGHTQVSHYDAIWWDSLAHEPFEVIS